jgi:hypothetical protein
MLSALGQFENLSIFLLFKLFIDSLSIQYINNVVLLDDCWCN